MYWSSEDKPVLSAIANLYYGVKETFSRSTLYPKTYVIYGIDSSVEGIIKLSEELVVKLDTNGLVYVREKVVGDWEVGKQCIYINVVEGL